MRPERKDNKKDNKKGRCGEKSTKSEGIASEAIASEGIVSKVIAPKTIVATGTVYLMFAGIIFIISNYLIHIGVARFLGPELYGIFGVLMSLNFINWVFLNTGVPLATNKLVSGSKMGFVNIFRSSLKLQLIVSLLFSSFYILFARWIAFLLKDASLAKYIVLLGIIVVPISLLSLFLDGFLSGLRKFKKLAFVKIILSFLRVFFTFFFMIIGFKIFGILIGYFVATIGSLLICWFYVKPRRENDKKNDTNKVGLTLTDSNLTGSNLSFNKIIKLAIPITLASLAFIFTKSVNVLFIKYFLEDNFQAGMYTAAATLSNVSYVFFSALPLTILPSISKSASAGNVELVRRYILKSFRYLLLLLLPVSAIVTVTADNLVSFLYTSVYVDAGVVLSVLIFSSTFFAIFSVMRAIIIGFGKAKLEMLMSFTALLIIIIANYVLIPMKGIFGAALASLISSVVIVVIGGTYIFSKYKVLIKLKSFFRISLSSFLVFVVAYFWQGSGVLLIANYVILFLLYFLLLYLFGELNKEDYDLVKKVLKLGR